MTVPPVTVAPVRDRLSAIRSAHAHNGPHPARAHRVALVTEYYYPHLGGICEHVEFLSRELRRRGHHVDIITSRLGDAPAPEGVIRIGRSMPVYSNGSMARVTIGFNLRREMRAVLRDGQYDVVHVHSPLAPTLPLLAIREAQCALVGTVHTYFPGSVLYKIFRKAVQKRVDRLDATIAVSDTAAEAFGRYFSADWRIIPNGVDLSVFRPDVPRPPELREDYEHILFLGRLDPRNGLTQLIRAFNRVRVGRKVRLVVVGDGPLRGHYERVAAGDSDIVFVGSVLEGRASYYAHSDVYACPTSRASFGMTLLEAMACGTPIVCTDLPGFRNVVSPDREALMVPHADETELVNALARVLDDAALRARLSAAARAHVTRFAWPHVTDEVLAVYDEVTANTGVAR